MLDEDGADKLSFASFNDFNNLSLSAFSFTCGEEHHLHEVTVEGVAEVAVRHEDVINVRFLGGVVLLALRDDKGHAAAFLFHATDDIVLTGSLGVLVLAVQLILAATCLEHYLRVDELVQLVFHLFATLFVENFDFGCDLLVVQFLCAVRQHVYDLFV